MKIIKVYKSLSALLFYLDSEIIIPYIIMVIFVFFDNYFFTFFNLCYKCCNIFVTRVTAINYSK